MKDSVAEMPSKGRKPVSQKRTSPSKAGWQARKSAAARDQIINAAIRCIIELGYSKTTTIKISEMAGLSRGATLHHFPSKMDVIAAVVHYLYEDRLSAVHESLRDGPKDPDIAHHAVRTYWAHLNHPNSKALFELSVAARTDSELSEVFRPLQQAVEREADREAEELFPEWNSARDSFELANDLCKHLLEGMAISKFTQAREYDEDRLLRYLEEKVRELVPPK